MQSTNTSTPASTFIRHIKTLSKKNFINWKRTPIGTALELLVPLFLAIYLVYSVKTATANPTVYTYDFREYQHPLYPTAYYNNQTDQWDSSYAFMMNQSSDFASIMNYTNYTNAKTLHNESYYMPAIDYFGPYNFIPRNCYASALDPRSYALPIIGYIERDNQIQQDLIDVLSLLFEGQSYMYNFTSSFFLSGINEDLNITR
jgi:hypothetical protein